MKVVTKKMFILGLNFSCSWFLIVGFNPTVFAGTKDGEGSILFQENTDITKPLDPTNPTKPISPTKPPTKGPLSIDFATDFSFGTHERNTTADEEYFATLATVKLLETGKKKKVPHFVQVTDNRNNGIGWKLYVQQNSPLTNEEGFVLKGATLNFYNVSFLSLDNIGKVPITNATNPIVISGDTIQNTLLAIAESGTGMGSYAIQFGGESEEGLKSISLKIPKSSEKKDGSYSTTLTWLLVDGL